MPRRYANCTTSWALALLGGMAPAFGGDPNLKEGAQLAADLVDVQADGWVYLGSVGQGLPEKSGGIYVRKVRRLSGNVRSVWALFVYDHLTPRNGITYRSMRQLFWVDCRRELKTLRKIEYFMTAKPDLPIEGSGFTLSADVAPDFSEAPPGSVAEGMIEYACTQKLDP